MELTQNEMKLLDAEDFRRLGVRPDECRLTVIRRAAVKSAKSLAEQQLSSPTPQVELQLTRIATSTYRLLDPRKRQDVYQRTFVGRILPNALAWAGRTQFHYGAGSPTGAATPFRSGARSDAELIEMLELNLGESPVSKQSDAWTCSLNSDDLIGLGSDRRRRYWMRRQLSRPSTMLALIMMLIATTFWLANWSGWRNRVALRRVQSVGVVTSQQPSDPAITDSGASRFGNRPLKNNSPSIEPPSLAAKAADVMPVDRDPQSVAVAGEVAELGAAQPLELRATQSNLPKSNMLVEAEVPQRPDPPVNKTYLEPVAELQASQSPASDLPPLDTLAIPELDVVVSEVKRYVLDLLKSDVWDSGPFLETSDLESRDADASALPNEMRAALPKDSATPAVEIASTEAPLAKAAAELQPLLATSYAGAMKLADSPETHQQLLSVGIRLAEQLLLAERFDNCNAVVSAARQSAEALEDEFALASLHQFTESVSLMSRQGETIAGIFAEDGQILNTVTSDKIGIAGRYYCFMLRRWETGLPWLVEATDPRIAGLAKRELSLGLDASHDEQRELAELWLAAASRASGRASDSMRLHAIALLRGASQQSSGLTKLELTRKIADIEQSLPHFVLASAVIESVPAAEPMAVKTSASPGSEQRGAVGLVGRLRSQGEDLGVRLIYEPGVEMTGVLIEQISERLEQELAAFEIELEGAFEIVEPTAVQVDSKQVAGVKREIWIDETPLDPDVAASLLDAGRHRIRWVIEVAEMSPLSLRVQDVSSRREIEITHPDSLRDDLLPTTLTVKMVRRSE